ncbi:hypothetical protein Q8A73_012627 [Channa argus]|nr:hypothetical protein Q8A73_012627 [Channa argus]
MSDDSSNLSNVSYDSDKGVDFFISNAFNITRGIILLPLSVFILCLGHRRWRQQLSFKAFSHSEIFTYHSAALEIICNLGTLAYVYGAYCAVYNLYAVGFWFCSLTMSGETSFHLLTCLDRYLAVVHPITYVGLRNERGVRIRNICTVCAWLLTFIFSALCVLIRPGPGEGGRHRQRVDQSKQRAFLTIMAITGVLWFWFLGFLVFFALEKSYVFCQSGVAAQVISSVEEPSSSSSKFPFPSDVTYLSKYSSVFDVSWRDSVVAAGPQSRLRAPSVHPDSPSNPIHPPCQPPSAVHTVDMSDNSTFLSNFSYDSKLFNCTDFTANFWIFSTFNFTRVVVLLPLSVFILYLGHRRCRLQRSLKPFGHSEIFTYHSAALETICTLGILVYLFGVYCDVPYVYAVEFWFSCLTMSGETSFHLLTCVDRYLAVVHPITYVGLRNERGFRIRNICTGCAWLLTIVWSWPGRRGRHRQQVDQSKQRAFLTIMAITGVLWFWFSSISMLRTSSNSSLLSVECSSSRISIFMLSALFVANILLILPLSNLVLYIGYQQWRQQRRISTATAAASHSDIFTYHMVAMEMIVGLGCLFYCVGVYIDLTEMMSFGLEIFSSAWSTKIHFHTLTCVERYLAVVHPVTYLGLKNKRGRSGPGEVGGDRARVDHIKRRAFYTIVTIMGVLLLCLGGMLMGDALEASLELSPSTSLFCQLATFRNMPIKSSFVDTPPHSSNSSVPPLSCLTFRKSMVIFTCFTITNILITLPLFSLVLYLGYQRWRQQRCISTVAAAISHSDVFTYHMVVMELIALLGCLFCFVGQTFNISGMITRGFGIFFSPYCVKIHFHTLTCVEHYVAVVHPVNYRGLKNTVLCALKRPGPGDMVGDREQLYQMKQRAFNTVMTIMAVLWFSLGGMLVCSALRDSGVLSDSDACTTSICSTYCTVDMSVNSTSPSNPSPNSVLRCSKYSPSDLINNAYNLNRIFLLLPLSILILYMGYRQWRQQRSFKAMSHSDTFTYHNAAMELVCSVGSVFFLCGIYYDLFYICGDWILSLNFSAETSFHLLTCVERYLAVVHPITYLGLRNARGITIRNIGIGSGWLLTMAYKSSYSPGDLINNAYNLTRILLFLPLSILILYMAYRQWRQQGSFKVMSHSDIFTYHNAAMELLCNVGSVIHLCGIYYDLFYLRICGYWISSLNFSGETSFHLLTCVERYLAVVHPITYLRLRNARGITIRNIGIGLGWLLPFVWSSVATIDFPNFPTIHVFCLLVFCVVTVSFCSLSVLCVLIRPGPGKGGGDRYRVDQSKQRAFLNMMAITGVLWLWLQFGLTRAVSAQDRKTILSQLQ